jgi:LacI family transcriptional regulator
VDFSLERPDIKIPRVIEDHAHGAQLVAKHFLSRGFIHFIFYGNAAKCSHQVRGKAFVETLKRSGYGCIYFQWPQSSSSCSWPERRKNHLRTLVSYLKLAPKPLAVFAASGNLAIEVLECCETVKLKVPKDVAIVGAENCLLAPDALRIPISSVDTNLETMGHYGARLLDDIMSGIQPPSSSVRVPAAGLVVRRSSEIFAVNHEFVARTLRLIQERHESITVKDLARALVISPRALHNEFLKHLKCTPGQALRNARIERAKRLLAEPANHKLEAVASACGLRGANSLCVR